jgi:hypothetical protein
VERHAVRLPDEFVAGAATRGWKVPPLDLVPERGKTRPDHSFWLQWAKGLPDAPEAQSLPDPRVFERFCLILRDLGRDAPDEQQVEGFVKSVWDKVRDEYGRHMGIGDLCVDMGIGDDLYIDGITVGHRSAVLARVIGGLHWYKLADQVELICSEPDPNDWQRDRNVAVWPPSDTANPI